MSAVVEPAGRSRSSPRRVQVAGDPLDPRGFPQAVADFREWMLMRNYAVGTVEQYQRHCAVLAAWLEERGITRPSEVTRPVLQRYQRWLYHSRRPNGRPLSFLAQHQRLTAVRIFFRWLARQNRLLYNPAADLELPKLERRLPKWVLSHAEAERVLAQPDLADPLGVRDRAILETFYATGIRRFELAGLSVYDLDAERGTLVVRQGKGRKDRTVPIGERAVLWIERYLAEVRPQFVVEPDEGVLFLGVGGEFIGLHRLSELVRDHVDAAGIGKRGSCHLFRHTMATLMLEGGADIRFIQQMLGHAHIAATEIYTKVSIRQLQRVYAASHPAAFAEHRRTPADNDGHSLQGDDGLDHRMTAARVHDPERRVHASVDGVDTAADDHATNRSGVDELLIALDVEAAEEDDVVEATSPAVAPATSPPASARAARRENAGGRR